MHPRGGPFDFAISVQQLQFLWTAQHITAQHGTAQHREIMTEPLGVNHASRRSPAGPCPESDALPDEVDPDVRDKPTRSNKARTTSTLEQDKTPQYVFVSGQDPRSMRSHAMREHWKQRRLSLETNKRKSAALTHRQLLPKHRTRKRPTSSSSSTSTIKEPPTTTMTSSDSDAVPPAEALTTTVKHEAPGTALERSAGSSSRSSARGLSEDAFVDGIPTQIYAAMDRALTGARFDPFDTFPVRLTAQHHKLLHHWFSTYAAMMFEDLPAATFNPVRDVWFPLDVSNAASFNVVLAHSAAHIARMHGYQTSNEAIKFKMEAIRIVASWMDDSQQALSDEVIAAVIRLLTYERHWGTEHEWKVHRHGIQQMIEARGGIASLQTNWRLELATFLVLLMTKPSWLDSSNHIREISSKQPLSAHLHPILGNSENLHKVRCLWLISFVQDLRTFMHKSAPHLPLIGAQDYPAIRGAMVLLETDFQQHAMASLYNKNCTHREFARLACLFFVCVLLQVSASAQWAIAADTNEDVTMDSWNSMDILETFLSNNRAMWQSSAENLYISLFHNLYDFPDKAQTTEYVLNLTSVMGAANHEARRGVERCLLHILFQAQSSPQDHGHTVHDGWTPDTLLSSLHGL
ncbi:tachykinin family protein [Purpureocillium lavendulum]|uniref:Tachykinin family protein n=1 Tax=Purpureocillium lavendulum TaxID=1247861 RepID=A0AB34FL78_9HYPO|nr:tachykinin family protein [Purpureocillium lavendulum]